MRSFTPDTLSIVWERLEDCYSSPEKMEMAHFNKLEYFPKISNRDSQCLQELGYLLFEVKAAKEERYLTALAYLDNTHGINPILEKMPTRLHEKWVV